MTSVLTVANCLLAESARQAIPLTPLQLMKLTYMSNGWMLAYTDKRLFDDVIEAWKYGPVIPELYRSTKGHGSSVIDRKLAAPAWDVVDSASDGLFEHMVRGYGRLSGAALSNMTHRPGSPWSQVYRDGVTHIEIPEDIIKAHYVKLKNSNEPVTVA